MKFRLTRSCKYKNGDVVHFKKFLWFPKAIDTYWHWLEIVNVRRSYHHSWSSPWPWQLGQVMIHEDEYIALTPEEKFANKFNKKFSKWLSK